LAATEAQMQAMQEAQDIDTGVDTRAKEEMLADQMSGLSSAGKTAIENIPGVGEAIVAKEVAEDVSAGDYLSAGIGTAALGVGFLPAGDILNKPLRAAAKKFRKQDNESAKKLMTDEPMFNIWKKENKLEESQRQKRVPKVQQAAIDLSAGKITSKEYRRTVTANQPIQPITKENFPDMPTKTEIVGALKATDPRKVDTGIIGLNKSIPDGTRVGSRLDIPSYDNYDKWIVSLHDGTVRNGKAIGYGQTAVLKNAEFISSAKGGVGIAKGKDKTTIARIHGDYQNAEPENVFEAAKRLIDDPEWTQVGMNPFRHSYFYDKATGNPVTKADEVIQVGPLVLAKGVKKPTLSEMKELVGGTKVVKDGKVTYKGAVRTEDGKIRTFNEGGMAMERQMEMFEDGGLMDEGGTVDPVSGNDVPPGSTQEEVRDDIPAQLSEGEFVFPADVVRYIGLGNLMRIRQEAKMGLKMMEEMGQMGNSDEATIPDDIPFDINDLDTEDEPEYNVGGFVPAAPQQQQFGIAGYTPAQQPTTGFTQQQPVQAASQQFVQQPTMAPAAAPVPTMQQYTPAEVPSFQQFVGGGFGEYDELREYKNEAGQTIQVPFKDGQPISPIPEGYTYVDPEATATEDVTTTPTTTETTQVREPDTSDADERRRAEEEKMFGTGGGRLGVRGKVYGVSFDGVGLLEGKGLLAGLAFSGKIPDKYATDVTVNIKRDDDEFSVRGDAYNELKDVIDDSGANSVEAQKKMNELRNRAKAIADAKAKAQAEFDILAKLKEDEEERKRTKVQPSSDDPDGSGPFGTGYTYDPESVRETTEYVQSGYEQEAGGGSYGGGSSSFDSSSSSSSGSSSGGTGSGSGYGGSQSAPPEERVGSGGAFSDRGRFGNKGMLVTRKKPKAKKMKQGGLASKK